MPVLEKTATPKLVISEVIDEQVVIDMTKNLADTYQGTTIANDQFHGELIARLVIGEDQQTVNIFYGKNAKDHPLILVIEDDDIQQVETGEFTKSKHFALIADPDSSELVLGRFKRHQPVSLTANILS